MSRSPGCSRGGRRVGGPGSRPADCPCRKPGFRFPRKTPRSGPPIPGAAFVYPLYAPVLQHGHGRGRHVDPDGAEEQKQGDTVQAAYGHIAAPRHFRVVVELPRPPGRVCLFELISHPHFCLEVLRFLLGDLLATLVILHGLISFLVSRYRAHSFPVLWHQAHSTMAPRLS